MADGALYIRNGAKFVWPNITPTLCLFHFIKAFRTKLYNHEYVPKIKIINGKVNNKPVPRSLLEIFQSNHRGLEAEKYNPSMVIASDIRILQTLPTQASFNLFLKFVKPFWTFFAPKFWNYFINEYVNESNSQCKSGWQNYIKYNSVPTNNSLEAFNKIIKEVQTNYIQLPISDYLKCLSEEATRRSIESAKIINFPKTPMISHSISVFAKLLVEKFESYFTEIDSTFYITDKFLNYTLYNKKRGTLKKTVMELGNKLESNHDESIEKFYSFYLKPQLREIDLYNKCEFKVRIQFFKIFCIRKIKISQDSDEELIIRNSSCTCPDWFNKRICPHLLACLIKEKKITMDVHWKNPKKRGRKNKVPGALVKI